MKQNISAIVACLVLVLPGCGGQPAYQLAIPVGSSDTLDVRAKQFKSTLSKYSTGGIAAQQEAGYTPVPNGHPPASTPVNIAPVEPVNVPSKPLPALAGSSGRKVALVFGNETYTHSPLSNPVRDANSMAAALQGYGFEVIKKTNATRMQMREAIRQFGDNIKTAQVVLFYYSGHGMQVKGENYLLPVDADIKREFEVADQSIVVSSVLGAIEETGQHSNIIILDACRDNPFKGWSRSSASGLARMDTPPGSFLAYATAPGSVAADGEPGSNGLYTSYLLKYMSTPGLKIEEVFKKVRVDVMSRSDGSQVPWESSSLTQDVYFIPEK
ncbi:MAG: caspase family protein [Methylovulum sp.]|nr:caspase family protein [Methylovulum sp.]